jgi:hypothetical protein
VRPDGHWFAVNTATGHYDIPHLQGDHVPGWPADGRYFVADFNGDGKDDRCFVRPDGHWFAVNTATGHYDIPHLQGDHVPGWPADGQYICKDFNKDSIADRCYVHPEGRMYVVNSATGQGDIPGYEWGRALRDAEKLTARLIFAQIATLACIATKQWTACVEAGREIYELSVDVREIVARREEEKLRRQSKIGHRSGDNDNRRDRPETRTPVERGGRNPKPIPRTEIGPLEPNP